MKKMSFVLLVISSSLFAIGPEAILKGAGSAAESVGKAWDTAANTHVSSVTQKSDVDVQKVQVGDRNDISAGSNTIASGVKATGKVTQTSKVKIGTIRGGNDNTMSFGDNKIQ